MEHDEKKSHFKSGGRGRGRGRAPPSRGGRMSASSRASTPGPTKPTAHKEWTPPSLMSLMPQLDSLVPDSGGAAGGASSNRSRHASSTRRQPRPRRTSSAASYAQHSQTGNKPAQPEGEREFLLRTDLFLPSRESVNSQELERFIKENRTFHEKKLDGYIRSLYESKLQVLNGFNSDSYDALLEKELIDAELSLAIKRDSSFRAEMQRLERAVDTELNVKKAYEREFNRLARPLPFYSFRAQILDTLKQNNVVVIVGQTGSGKSTQVPQYLIEAGVVSRIACTQPRRIAAISLAKRISRELLVAEDTLVTWRVGGRPTFRKGPNSPARERLVVMTDKLLLNEYKSDKMLMKYSCVIIDEAHERTLYTDIMLCELKKLVEKRASTPSPLKLIIMSATIDEEKFAAYFNSCPIIAVPGVMHHVEMRHEKMRPDYLEHTLSRVQSIIDRKADHPGDVLVFLPSGDDINRAIRRTQDYTRTMRVEDDYVILGLKGSMDPDEQEKLFLTYEGKTKLIYSTNVAEMSVTIDGVRVIVDSGRVKEMVYDQERNISLLKLAMISKSSAIQRRGRAGRTSSGICYRLFERTDYENMEPALKPEIQRMHLGLVILQAMSCGIADVVNYDFIDRPEEQLLSGAMEKLEKLKLLRNGKLTVEGRLAAELYLEPSIACILIEAIKNNCQDEVTKIISMMSISSRLFESKMSKQDKSEKILSHSHTDGDFLTYLKLFNHFRSLDSYRKKREWCNQNHYVLNSFNLAANMYDELSVTLKKLLNSREYQNAFSRDQDERGSIQAQNQTIIETICAGLHPNLAFYTNKLKDGTKVYKIVRLNQEAFIDFSSCLFALGDEDANCELLLFSDLFRTDKLYMRNLTPISLEVLRKYSDEDYSWLARQVKRPVSIDDLNPFLIQMMDNDWIESLERELSFHVYKREKAIVAEVTEDRAVLAKTVMTRSVLSLQAKKIRELYEFRPDGQRNCRIVMGAGFKIECVLLSSNEFLRINIDNLNLSVTDQDLYDAFRDKFGKILDWRVFNSSLNPTKTGYVIFSNPSDAEKALKTMQNASVKGMQIRMAPSKSIEKRAMLRNNDLIVSWYLAEPTGRIFLTMRATEASTSMLRTRLDNDGYRVVQKIDKKDPANLLFRVGGFNYKIQDENQFIEYYSRYVRFHTCSFERKKIIPTILETPIDNVKAALVSYFEQFGPILGQIDLVPYQIAKDGTIKDKCTVYLKYTNPADTLKAMEQTDGKLISDIVHFEGHSYGFGRVSAKTQFTEEYQMPSKAIDLLQKEINQLKVILNSEYKSLVKISDKADKFDKKTIMMRTFTADKHDESVQLANEILKPKTMSLSYTRYERVRKLLSAKNNELRDELQNIYTVFISIDSRFKQVSIYGAKKSQEAVCSKLNALITEAEPPSRTINIKSFKALLDKNGNVYEDLKAKYKGDFQIDFKRKTLTFHSKEGRMDELEKEVNEIQHSYLIKQRKPAGYRFQRQHATCGICGDQVEEPFVLLTCSHTFCTSCIKNQFKCTDISMDFTCVTCNCEICILDLRRLGEYSEELVNAKASLIVEKEFMRSQKYGYCKECNQISKIETAESNKILDCQRCKRKYCLNCDRDSHGSTSCKEAANNTSLFDKYKEKFTKPCPHCKAPIEKNEGCNKMHCIACNKFMCWICQAGFNTQEEAYTHINKTHPGKLYENVPE